MLLLLLLARSCTKTIFKPRLFCSHATSHKVDWIITDWLPALPCPFIVHCNKSNERYWIRRFMCSPCRELYHYHLSFVRSHTCLSLFPSLGVVGLLGSCSMYLCHVYCESIVSCCVRFRCALIIYIFHTHGLCLFAQLLLIVIMWNDISSFPFA